MGPLKGGFLNAVKAIKGNKLLFAVLIAVQILFIVSALFVGIKYQLKVYENVKGIIEPLESMDQRGIENLTVGEGALMEDLINKMVSVSKNYEGMVRNILKMVFLILGCFLVFNGWCWSLANVMIKKGKLWKYWARFALVSLMFLMPVSLAGYFILINLIGGELGIFKLGMEIAGGIFLAMGYFLLIGFCLAEERLKDLLKNVFLIGIKKAHWVLLSLLCCLLSISLGLVLIYFSMDNFWLMLLSGLILVIILALGKLFLVGVVKEIRKPIL